MLEFLKKLGFIKLSIVAGSALVLLILFGVTIFANSNSMKILYGNLSPTDKYDIVRFLSQIGADYIVEEDSILVQAEKIRELRMFLASEGVPGHGTITGYEIFNKEDSFSTSSFTQNVNLLRALEGELARTIMSFDQVKTARVHLVLPKRELFRREKPKATASVMLRLTPGATLSKKEVRSISNFVASAVPDLSISDVTIVGADGYAFKTANNEIDEEISFANHEYKIELERHVQKTIEELLERSAGVGKVKAEVSIDIDFDQIVTDSETYDPSGQVVRSTQTIEERSKDSNSGGNVSVENNIPNSGVDSNTNISNSERSDEITNYEISHQKRQQIKKGGAIKSMSIAVLVDGVYDVDPKTGQQTYTPQNDDTLDKFKILVASAVGINPDRGDKLEIINLKFVQESAPDSYPEKESFIYDNLLTILIVIFVLLSATAIALLGVKPIVMKMIENKELRIAKMQEHHDMEQANADQTGNNDENLSSDKIIKHLNLLVGKSPQNAVSLLRRWMDSTPPTA